MIAELHVFDFDGTLFNSPLPPVSWKGPREAWWEAEESLLPPHVPDPPLPPNSGWWHEDVVAKAMEANEDCNDHCVMLTGRRKDVFNNRVREMLDSKFDRNKFYDIRLVPPTEPSTRRWKIRTIQKLILKHRPRFLYMYEDREELLALYEMALAPLVPDFRLFHHNGTTLVPFHV